MPRGVFKKHPHLIFSRIYDCNMSDMHNWPSIDQLIGPERRNQDNYWVRAVFASTITGSTSINGRSQDLGNQLDTELLLGLREWAEVILVGSGTVRAEDYAGVQPTDKKPNPAPLAVVTSSLDFDYDSRFFHDYHVPHLFMVPESSLQDPTNYTKVQKLQAFGEVISTGSGTIRECLTTLVNRGFARISCEGGPSILGGLISANAVDQFYLTIDPTLTNAVESPITRCTSDTTVKHKMRLESSMHCPDSTLFLRYGHPRVNSM